MYTISTNIKDVIRNKELRNEATYVITHKGEEYWLLRGDKIKPGHFELMFPIQVIQTKNYNQ